MMTTIQRDDEDEHSDDAPLVAEPASFGTWLRQQREVREIDLREIADSSKVSMTYLRALEEDRFEVLPAPVFAKGFLRQYARYVGLDPEEVVNFYLAARHPEDEGEPALQPRIGVPEPPSRNYLLIGAAVVVALVLLVWLLSVFSKRSRSESPATTTPAPESAVLPSADDSGLPTSVPTLPEAAAPPAETDQSLAEPSEEPGSPLLVTLDFMSDCWVEASVDGFDRLSELKVQGESLLLDAEEVVEFKVGDVSAVRVEVNGLPFEIKDRRGTSVRQVRIDLETAAALEQPAEAADESTTGELPQNATSRTPSERGADR